MKNINTFTSQADFDRVGKQIADGVPGYKALLQIATIAAFKHLAKHGNFNVLKPLWQAAETFSLGEGRRWHSYVIEYSFLIYNPKGLKGTQIETAIFSDLWAKDKSKEMRIAEASKDKNEWFNHQMGRGSESTTVEISKYVETLIKRVERGIAEGKFTKGNRKATVAEVRAELKHAIESMTITLKSLEGGKATRPNTQTKRSPTTATPKAKATVGKVTEAKVSKKAA